MKCKVQVITASCISSGRCIADAPDLFAFDDERIATVIQATADLTPDRADELMDGCPGGAIEITFEDAEA